MASKKNRKETSTEKRKEMAVSASADNNVWTHDFAFKSCNSL